MLNSKALSDLLSKNSDDRLCKRWFLMTPNGTLVAYTHPTNIRDLRRQAAKAAILWQDNQTSQQPTSAFNDGDTSKSPIPSLLRTLTIESETGNTIIRKVQPQILLVLEGGTPPRRRNFEPRTTPEGPGDPPYPVHKVQQADHQMASSVSSAADSAKSNISRGVLGLQRRKLDALAAAIAHSFQQTGFKMPDEGNTKAF
jgi:hypothetical protein